MTRVLHCLTDARRSIALTPYVARCRQRPSLSSRRGQLRGWLAGSLLLAAVWSQHSQAQSIFTCKDDNGRTLTSDRPIPECSRKVMREMSSAGVVKNEHAAPLTPEQLRQKKAEDEDRRLAEIKRRQEESRDKALLVAFPNMAALEAARARQVNDLKSELVLVESRIVKEYQTLKAAQAEAKSQGSNVSFAARRKVQVSSSSILTENDVLTRIQAEINRTNQRFDDDAKRLGSLLREPDTAASAGQKSAAVSSR